MIVLARVLPEKGCCWWLKFRQLECREVVCRVAHSQVRYCSSFHSVMSLEIETELKPWGFWVLWLVKSSKLFIARRLEPKRNTKLTLAGLLCGWRLAILRQSWPSIHKNGNFRHADFADRFTLSHPDWQPLGCRGLSGLEKSSLLSSCSWNWINFLLF